MPLLFLATAAITAALYGYTAAFQAATLYWGRMIAPDQPAMRTAITPPAQTVRNLAIWVLFAVLFMIGFLAFPWYNAIAVLLATFFAAIVFKRASPARDSLYFRERIRAFLGRSLAHYRSTGDHDNAAATSRLIEVFDDLDAGEVPAAHPVADRRHQSVTRHSDEPPGTA